MSKKTKFKKILARPRQYHRPDYKLIIILFLIIIFGLLALSSASSVLAYKKFGSAYYYFNHQLFGLSLGIISFLILAQIDYRLWRKYAFGFLLFSIVLLLLVFIPGLSANYGKARSWINVFGYSLQPSEFVKISFLIYLAAWLETRKKKLNDISLGIGPFVVILLLISFLMILQPDIGTLSIIGITSLLVYFVGGGDWKHLLLIIIFSGLAIATMIQFRPYQLNRFRCLFDPDFSPNNICYQTTQSLIAVGSGGFWGRGFGESKQKYLYLPEVNGDSIFAVIGEELGLFFSTLFILAFLYLMYRGYRIALFAPDDFGRNLAVGITAWISIQAIINIGGIINLMPMTGVPLPFVSYGGSSILTSLIAMGILVNISKQTTSRKIGNIRR